MKTILSNFSILLFLVCPFALLAHNGTLKGRYTKEKTIKKEYDVTANPLLKVDNSYGNLNLISWDENRILIEVHIKTNGNNEEKVQRKLDEISVDFDASDSSVSAKTIFAKERNSWGWGGNTKVNMQINYTIKLPIKSNVSLSNDYGSIALNRVDGHARISCDYGRLDIGELRGRNNSLSFDYTSNSRIGYMNSGKINADYSGFTIEKAGDLDINADYTNSKIEKMGNLDYSCDYGKIEIGEAENVRGTGDYISVRMGTMHGNVDITADYGSLKIDKLAKDAGNVLIKTDYTGVKIGYDPAYNFDFEIRTSYAGVSGKDDFEMSISEVRSTSKHYKGFYGTAGSGNSINITSDYGSISFHKN